MVIDFETVSSKRSKGPLAMSQSLAQIYLHIVFSTKNRKPFLQHAPSRLRLHKFLAKTCNNLDSPCLEVGGVEDHVHILCRLSKTMSPSDLIKELKRVSSEWVKSTLSGLEGFYWQNGYGAFSVSPSHVAALQKYIANQEEHHRRESFQDEFRRLLKKYGVEYDERYVWD
jgi:REP element-mobilizing transposase RayT